MAEILITHSYFLHFDPKQFMTGRPYPPLATLYVAALLKKKGFDLAFHDVMFSREAEDIIAVLDRERPSFFIICDDGFNYLTKMCLTNMRDAAFAMITHAKKAGCTVIVSSSDATDHSREYLEKGADFVVAGEPEQTICELVAALKSGKSTETVAGLRYTDNGALKQTQARENLQDLDSLPFPMFELADMDTYRRWWMKSSGYFSINMVTTRGCPFKCNWCAKPIYGNRYNSRSPENVVKELVALKQKYQVDHIWFCDDIFGLKPGWVSQFSGLVRDAGIQVKFKIQSRVDLLLEDDEKKKNAGNIASLASAGCDEIWVGAESGSQKILDAMDKGTRVEQIYEATRLMKKNHIKPCFFLQFGYPGEDAGDIRATIKMVFDLMPHDLGISVSYPLPGTRFYENVKAQLKDKANWTDSDELAMMFNGNFPAGFYKKLQRYVHSAFRRTQAFRAVKDHLDIRKGLSLAFRVPQSLILKFAIRKYVG